MSSPVKQPSIMSNRISNQDLLKLYSRMIKEATIRGNRYPEDIAQTYVERLLTGLHAKATVGQAYIDILRTTTGSKRMPGYKKKQSSTMVATQDAIDAYNATAQYETGETLFYGLDIQRVMAVLKPGKTALVFSLLMAGNNQKDISIKMGLTESRVNQIVNNEIDRIRYLLDV